MSLLHHDVRREAFAVASHLRDDFFDFLTARGDTLFELTDALLCADGPVKTPVDLTLTAEHRRGHGAMYKALNGGNVDVSRRSACRVRTSICAGRRSCAGSIWSTPSG